MTSPSSDFPSESLLSWYADHGRHDLPWRAADRSPFDLLVAEILLQRTTAAAAAGAYGPLLARYPSPAALAAAPIAEIEAMTAPLGLAKRAEYLQRTAATLLAEHDGEVPDDRAALLACHGVGSYTARSLLVHCHDADLCAVDANVARILTRFFDLGPDATDAEIADLADDLVPKGRADEFLHALLDLGAAVCTARSPDCGACPLAGECARAASECGRVANERARAADEPTGTATETGTGD